jgi:undecaprenyl-diphosphatase
VLLIACVAVTAMLGAWLMHRTGAGWLDTTIDGRLKAALGGHQAILGRLGQVGDPAQVTWITAGMFVACVAARRWRGAVLVAAAVPAAGALTEGLLKPFFDRTAQGHLEFPSGHATGAFAMAAACAVLLAGQVRPRLPAAVRLLLAVIAFLVAGGVAIAVVALGFHYFTDTVAGAAVGTGVVLAAAFILDRLGPRGASDLQAGPAVRADGMAQAPGARNFSTSAT